MNKYSEGQGHDPNNKNSSHWLNWLGGIVAYEYESVPKMEQYLLSDEHAHEAVSRYRKAEARRFEAKYGRPKKGRKKKTTRKR